MFKMKKTLLMLLCLVGVCSVSQKAYATDYSYLTEKAPEVYMTPSLDSEGKTSITWVSLVSQPEDKTVTLSYEIELAKNQEFTEAQTFTSVSETLELDKTTFGANGGKFYIRIRNSVNITGETPSSAVSPWSEVKEMVFVKINKTNFPGMYKVLQNGGKESTEKGIKKVIYDTNKDGWLDPVEIENVNSLSTKDTYKKKKGKQVLTKAPTISSFKGVEFLTGLDIVSVDRFSGKKADLSNCPAYMVNIKGVTSKQITVIAPNAEMVYVQPEVNTKITKIDLSKCNNAYEILAYGNKGTKTLKLPKNKKNLQVLSLSEYGFKSLDLNSYTNLQQLYLYECNMKTVKVNKCKDLRYIYFYFCDNIKSLDLKSNKKLRGADFYETPGLTKSTVKRPKNGKYTWNKGKWWYSTAAYKKDMNKLYNMPAYSQSVNDWYGSSVYK